jgi:hypothetical protein
VWAKGLFEALDFCGAENMVEEHLGEDVVGWELGRSFVSIQRREYAGAVGTCGCENGTRYSV